LDHIKDNIFAADLVGTSWSLGTRHSMGATKVLSEV